MQLITEIMFIIIPIFIGLTFLFALATIISPKLRGKIMSRQIKSIKHMTDYSQKYLEDIEYNIKKAHIDAEKKIVDKKYSDLESIYTNISSAKNNAVKQTMNAVKEGLDGHKYCQNCARINKEDATYCDKCGKKL